MATLATPRADSLGHVSADSLYTLAEIQKRLKLGDHALRQARRRGLKVRRIGRRAYLLGRDIIEFIDKVAK